MECVTGEYLRKTKAIGWKNIYSTGLQQLLDDPDIVIGYDSTAKHPKCNHLGAWVIAQVRPRIVIQRYGNKDMPEKHRVPVILQQWRDDDTGQPLRPDDPRLVEHLNRSKKDDVIGKMMRAEDRKKEESRKFEEEMQYRLRSVYPSFRRAVDA